ncbi:MAG: DUF6776 family protein [Gammaproteobacteria bacterium]
MRRRILAVILFILMGALAWSMFELGLNRAGFKQLEAMSERRLMESEIRELEARNKRLSERIAVLEIATKVDTEAYGQVETELVGLQEKILEQQEDIEFYKGIVNADDGTGLRIQDFQITRGIGEREYDLRLVLAQAFRSDRKVSGRVEMVVEGVQRGKAVRLGLGELGSEDAAKSMNYSFRYFQDFKAAVVLPQDFAPERVQILIKTAGKSAKTVEEFFIWEIKAG